MTDRQVDLRNELLGTLYECGKTDLMIDPFSWAEERGLGREETATFYESLHRDGLTRLLPQNGIGLTIRGIEYVESNGLADGQIVDQRTRLRRLMMSRAYDLHLDPKPRLLTWKEVARGEGHDDFEGARAFGILQAKGYVQDDHLGCYRLTEAGIQFWERAAKLKSISAEWDELRSGKMSPSKRGHALEALFADIAGLGGAEVILNARTRNEENDLVLRCGSDFWVVSCKWEAKVAKGSYLDVLMSRMAKRHGSRGVLVSASGFSGPCKSEVEAGAQRGLVVLIGPGDLDLLTSGEVELGNLLNDRLKTLVAHFRAEAH